MLTSRGFTISVTHLEESIALRTRRAATGEASCAASGSALTELADQQRETRTMQLALFPDHPFGPPGLTARLALPGQGPARKPEVDLLVLRPMVSEDLALPIQGPVL